MSMAPAAFVFSRTLIMKGAVAGRMPDMLWMGSMITPATSEKSAASRASTSFQGRRRQGARRGA